MATIPSTTVQKFAEYPTFQPHYTPREILELGAFGGIFFSKATSRKYVSIDLFRGMPRENWDNVSCDDNINYFKVHANSRRRDYRVPIDCQISDPFGWFEWYCKMFYNRKLPGCDKHRIDQWRDELQTIMFYVQKECTLAEVPLTDLTIAPVWRQHALHFGWDSTKPFNL